MEGESSNRELARLVYQHDKDMYYGNGKPGLTTRMEKVEDAVKAIHDGIEKQEKKQDRIELLVWAAVIAGIANLIFGHLK